MKKRISISTVLLRLCCGPLLAIVSSMLFPGLVAAGTVSGHQSQASLTPIQVEIEKQKQRLTSAEVEERRDAVLRLGRLSRPEASRAAVSALSDPMPIVRATAASAILSLPVDESALALIPLLTDLDEFVRREATYALGHSRSRRAVPAVIERLTTDKEDGVRGAAASALGGIGDETAVTALAEVLLPAGAAQSGKKGRKRKAKENQFVLRAAARSLGQIGSRAGVPALIAALSTDTLSEDIRREAAHALGLIGDPSAVPALRAAAAARDPCLSRIAYESLRKLVPKEPRIPS
jgi:HEAT repeat protein